MLPSESTDWMSCCTSSCSLPWKVSTRFPCSIRTPLFIFFYQAVFPYWLLLSTINVSLSRLNFYFNAASVHGRSCRPSVESADCIEIPPASERVFLEIPSSCLIAKTTQPVTSYIYIIKSYNYIYVCIYSICIYKHTCIMYSMSTVHVYSSRRTCSSCMSNTPLRSCADARHIAWCCFLLKPLIDGCFQHGSSHIQHTYIIYKLYIYG